jgi:BCD family chlorophyll transporter-like MFS transporter
VNAPGLGWVGIVRLGLVQCALGAIVVLTTSTMNRVMVVELALPALLPGALVGLHYAVQVLRPRFGHGSDVGGRRTPWIIGGMAVLGAGALLAALAIAWMPASHALGVAASVLAFLLVGVGVGAAGTSLLVLLATLVEDRRRGAAASITWTLMIVGFIVSTAVVGHLLDPYSAERLVLLTGGVAAVALLVTTLAVAGIEPARGRAASRPDAPVDFGAALREVWSEGPARRFTVFIFVSMLAYSSQDLILEPFAGTVFGLTPGETTRLSSLQHGGVLVGMLLVALASTVGGSRFRSLRLWTIAGCVASALALAALALAGASGGQWPLRETVFCLGVANGAFAVAAIGSMMGRAASGHGSREGVRMGLWGAAQAIAFGIGGLLGAGASDLSRALFEAQGPAYATVFALEAVLFIFSAAIAARLDAVAEAPAETPQRAPRLQAKEQSA